MVPMVGEIKRELFEFFQRNLGTENVKIEIENGCSPGDNFIGLVYRVVGTGNDGRDVQRIFLKIAPSNATRRQRFRVRASFLREMFVYNEVRA